jgi:hypothetical protein
MTGIPHTVWLEDPAALTTAVQVLKNMSAEIRNRR